MCQVSLFVSARSGASILMHPVKRFLHLKSMQLVHISVQKSLLKVFNSTVLSV